MSERLDLADAACPARFQPNFLRAAKPKAKTALAAGLKTRDAPIRVDAARERRAKRGRAPIRLLV